MNFKEIFLTFIEEKRLTSKLSTVSRYYSLCNNHILPKFKDRDICTISETELTKHLLEEKKNNLRKKGIYLSQKSLSDIAILLNAIFKYSYKKKFIKEKINISVPKNFQNMVQIFTSNDKNKIKDYIFNNTTYYGIAILLSLYTGIRIGEACALTWGDINLENEIIRIDKTIQRIKNMECDKLTKTKIIIDTPKSDKSIRDVPIPKFLIPLLSEFKGEDNCYIAKNTVTFVEPRQLQKKYKTVLKNANVNYKKYHSLRHTFATNAYNNGMNIKSLSEILGHASIEITLKLYVHTSIEQKQKEMNLIYADI